LVVPTIVRDASNAYFAEQDTLAQWAEQAIVRAPGAFILTDILFQSWREYCEKGNLSPGTKVSFSDALEEQLHYERARRNYGRAFKDITLKTPEQPGLAID
jgi:phage/plasmid-associated DNA primase